MNETSPTAIQSSAFQRALLQSKQLRLRGLLVVLAIASCPAADIIAHLATALQAFAAGAPHSDDLTAVVVRKL